MKTYKKIGLFILSLGMFTFNSCLNFDAQDTIGDSNFWKSANDFKYFASNFYGWTRDFSSVTSDGPHSDWRSDLWASSSINIYAHGSNTSSTSDGNYATDYARIRRTNLLLTNAASYTGSEDISTYVAETKFFRAYVYFDLLQLYGDVIWTNKVLDVSSEELTATRTDRSIVVDSIISDLNSAISGLPSTVATSDAGRLTKWAASAFLSRVALYEGTWQKFHTGAGTSTSRSNSLLTIAVNAAQTVMNSGQFSLFAPSSLGVYAYKYLFILEDSQSNPANITKSSNTEYIWARRHDQTISPIGINITKGELANVLYVNRKFANMYLGSDGLPIDNASSAFKGYSGTNTEFINRDNRMKNSLLPDSTYYWNNQSTTCRVDWKGMTGKDSTTAMFANVCTGSGYQNQKWAAERLVTDTYEGYDFPIIRYAEVLLNYAEALFERDGAISDDNLNLSLNLVRQRVNTSMPKLSNTFVSTYGLDMRTEIRRERTVELYNEGFRIDDLKRWKTAGTEMPADILGIKWTGTAFTKKWTKASSISKNSDGCLILETGRSWEDKNYLYPIPVDQLQLNSNLGQNPGW